VTIRDSIKTIKASLEEALRGAKELEGPVKDFAALAERLAKTIKEAEENFRTMAEAL
jgi:hypothetical protein